MTERFDVAQPEGEEIGVQHRPPFQGNFGLLTALLSPVRFPHSLRWHDPEQVHGCDLSPHGKAGVRDLGTINGTMVNGTAITRTSLNTFVPLRVGDKEVIAGQPNSPFRFRIQVAGP